MEVSSRCQLRAMEFTLPKLELEGSTFYKDRIRLT